MASAKNAIASMTGFARCEGGDEEVSWAWEIKAVNGRNLDIRTRLPYGLEELDAQIRKRVQGQVQRGNLQINLTVKRLQARAAKRINPEVLEELSAVMAALVAERGWEKPRVDGVLALKGVIEEVEPEDDEATRAARLDAMAADLEGAVRELVEVRRAEGARLLAVIETQLAEIARLTEAAGACSESQPAALRARLEAQVAELLDASPPLPEERLAQEAALLAVKADIREEIDRLKTHCGAAGDLLEGGGAVGRRFDFLCQEFNREANTLCSKATAVELTQIGLALKSAIDQLREQIQNIE